MKTRLRYSLHPFSSTLSQPRIPCACPEFVAAGQSIFCCSLAHSLISTTDFCRNTNNTMQIVILYGFIKNITQTAVTNIMEQRMLLIFKYISNLTFYKLQHTPSEVTVRLSYNKLKTGCRILVTSK